MAEHQPVDHRTAVRSSLQFCVVVRCQQRAHRWTQDGRWRRPGGNRRIKGLSMPENETAKKPHTYKTQLGVVLELRPISALTLRQLQKDRTGEPKPPKVESFIGQKKQKVV